MRARPIQQEWRKKLGKVILRERIAIGRYKRYCRAVKEPLSYAQWLEQSNIELAPREWPE